MHAPVELDVFNEHILESTRTDLYYHHNGEAQRVT